MGAMSIKINKKEYTIIKELGKGGFGRVVQVLSKSDNKNYAIKIIPIKGETKDKIKSFQSESDILSKFNCNNIVKYYDSSKDGNNIYILMEYCSGENLRSFIDKNMNNNTYIEENILITIIIQICRGIEEMHNKKIIHRDLKPDNIFINGNMNIKIGDFGISKQIDSYKTLTLTKYKKRTDYYVAPEIIVDGIYNEKSDMWSLGCIIYELFNLSVYYKDTIFRKIKTIDSKFYNNKWQELINLLLEPDYKKRFDIHQVNAFLKEDLKINYKDSINKIDNEINIDNKVNIIKCEIDIKDYDIKRNIPVSKKNEKMPNKLVFSNPNVV